MKSKQKGLTLTGLLLWGMLISLVAITGFKLVPEYVTYYKILAATKAAANDAAGKNFEEIRTTFSRRLEVDHVTILTPADLRISREGDSVVLSFAYERKVPLVHNISFLLDFQGTARGRN